MMCVPNHKLRWVYNVHHVPNRAILLFESKFLNSKESRLGFGSKVKKTMKWCSCDITFCQILSMFIQEHTPPNVRNQSSNFVLILNMKT